MPSHCLKFKKNTENINPRFSKASNRKKIPLNTIPSNDFADYQR